MGRPRKPKGPPRVGGKIDHPDLFLDWLASRVAALLGDVSSVSLAAAPAGFALFLTLWLSSPEGSVLRTVLAIATTVCGICTGTAWLTKALRSKMRDEVAIISQGVAVVAVGLMMSLVVVAGWYQDFVRSSPRQETINQQQQEDKAARAAAAEVERQTQVALAAAARAAAAKDEAVRQSETARARVAEAKCMQTRDDAIQKATIAQSSARKALEDCKTQYNETLISFQTVRAFCKPAFGRLDSARAQLAEAKSNCGADSSTGSIGKTK